MIKTRRYKRLVFRFVLCTWNWYDFWRRSWASLVRGPYCQLDVGLCDVDVFLHWDRAAEEGAWVGLKPDLQGGTGFNLLRVHFWTPVQGNVFQKKVRKWPAWNQKWFPWRVQFWSLFGPFNVANLLRRLFQVEADLTSNSCGWNLELGRPIFARLLFLTFWGPKKGPFFVILFCSNFHSLEALKACREACPDVFCSNFHGLATLEFKTCIEACLQLCFIL